METNNDDDVYGAAVTRYIIYLLFFFPTREDRGGRVSGRPCQTDNNSLKLN